MCHEILIMINHVDISFFFFKKERGRWDLMCAKKGSFIKFIKIV